MIIAFILVRLLEVLLMLSVGSTRRALQLFFLKALVI